MKDLKKDLEAVNKQLNALSKKIEKLIAAVSKTKKLKAAEVQPAKKPVVKLRKKAVAKKEAGETAPEIVLYAIQNSEGDVGIETLKEKTGFHGQKLYNTLYMLKKQGKIKNPNKGVYVKA